MENALKIKRRIDRLSIKKLSDQTWQFVISNKDV
jgi:hypothetical protein